MEFPRFLDQYMAIGSDEQYLVFAVMSAHCTLPLEEVLRQARVLYEDVYPDFDTRATTPGLVTPADSFGLGSDAENWIDSDRTSSGTH